MPREMSLTALRELAHEKAELTYNKFKDFSTGTRVLLLLLREKDGGGNTDFKRRSIVEVTHNTEQFEKAIHKMVYFSMCSPEPYRIYSTVNERDLVKAERIFKQQMLEMDFVPELNKRVWYERFESRWHSALMQDNSRKTSAFMLDIDDEEFSWSDIQKKCWEQDIEILFMNRTKNGWHFITEPFNPELLGEYKSVIKKDAQILLHW